MRTTRASLEIDKTITLEINGSRQVIRLCAAGAGLPPLLIVQGGPGLPLLHEVAKFRRLLNLENDFLVGYWEQRGCGNAPLTEAPRVSLRQQVDDMRTVLRWLHAETGKRALVLGISWGATIALQAVAHEADCVTSVVAISPDLQTADNDAAGHAFLQELAVRAGSHALRRRLAKLGAPPYLDLSRFQSRMRLMVDLGTIERKKRFGGVLRELVVDLVRTYGIVGGVRALRNMNAVQRTLLPEIAALDLLAHPPRVTVPVHYVFGEQDALTRASAATTLPVALTPPNSTVLRVPDAGHMVHFDQPHIVRSVMENA
jgi:pimeloyl-ACP methyl ester carboxylesterase